MGPHHTVLHGLKYILQFNNSITENEHFNRFFFFWGNIQEPGKNKCPHVTPCLRVNKGPNNPLSDTPSLVMTA